ncbi:hypothetical protein G7Y89_g10883 [Cudoniella acicularis]|uniref:Uncharacterized protein n=1 Tax=Cudoniella acicularis TaxID=354080 RepID=A0A8H4RBW0_9HELO|nr:hypothetical protein G7Y89_g10883 [Cudoniella acicularis]
MFLLSTCTQEHPVDRDKPVDQGIIKCSNYDELRSGHNYEEDGHGFKSCPRPPILVLRTLLGCNPIKANNPNPSESSSKSNQTTIQHGTVPNLTSPMRAAQDVSTWDSSWKPRRPRSNEVLVEVHKDDIVDSLTPAPFGKDWWNDVAIRRKDWEAGHIHLQPLAATVNRTTMRERLSAETKLRLTGGFMTY